MKLAIYTDVHISDKSSILETMGDVYSTRIEYIIKGINWAEEEAQKLNCDAIISLGDFFDKPTLTPMVITALKEIKWAELPHYFLCGNHEGTNRSLAFNSVYTLNGYGFKIIDKAYSADIGDYALTFIPYINENIRKPLKEYLDPNKPNIVFSHNDVKGIQYGCIQSKEGFDINEIDENCALFLNGHLHNGTKFSNKGINLGNFTGQNFTEDAFKYSHNLFILDTDNLTLESVENPYALKFYKVDILHISQLHKLREIKDNAIVAIRCIDTLKNRMLEVLGEINDKILAKRIIYTQDLSALAREIKIEDLTTENYLQQFIDFSIEAYGKSDILLEELDKIIGGNI